MQISFMLPTVEPVTETASAPAANDAVDGGGAFAALLATMTQPAPKADVDGQGAKPLATEDAPAEQQEASAPEEAPLVMAELMPYLPPQPTQQKASPPVTDTSEAAGPQATTSQVEMPMEVPVQSDAEEPEPAVVAEMQRKITVLPLPQESVETTAPMSVSLETADTPPPPPPVMQESAPKPNTSPSLRPAEVVIQSTEPTPQTQSADDLVETAKPLPQPVAATTPLPQPLQAAPPAPMVTAVEAAKTPALVAIEPPEVSEESTEEPAPLRTAPKDVLAESDEPEPVFRPSLSVETVERVMARATVTRQAWQEPVRNGEESPEEPTPPVAEQPRMTSATPNAKAVYTVMPAIAVTPPEAAEPVDAPELMLESIAPLTRPAASPIALDAETTPVMQTAGPPAPLEVPVAELDRFTLRGVRQLLDSGEQRMTLKIQPESMGELQIEVVRSGGDVQVKLAAATQQVRDLLESQTHHLREALVREGFEAPRIQIVQQPAGSSGANAGWTSQQGNPSSYQQQQPQGGQGGHGAWQGQRYGAGQQDAPPPRNSPAAHRGDGLNVVV